MADRDALVAAWLTYQRNWWAFEALNNQISEAPADAWATLLALIEARVRGSLEVAQFVLVESEAVLWYDDSLKKRAHGALTRLSEQLGAKT